MTVDRRKLPLDARLLSEAIIELNISRRHVALYPANHPLAERSLGRALDFFEKLLDLRPSIMLAVSKDTIFIDDYFLDRKNPVYKEFALHLHRMNIASITFNQGVTGDELYRFLRLISEKAKDDATENTLQKILEESGLKHIHVGFIDYGAFTCNESADGQDNNTDEYIWERYVHGLLEGTLQTDEQNNTGKEIPPDVFAKLMNRAYADKLKDETYDRVITTYLRKSSDRAFSSNELKKLLEFINGLKPELKKQFLTSTIRFLPKDRNFIERTLKEIPVDKVIDLLKTINEQKMVIPDPLKNLLDKFTKLSGNGADLFSLEDGILADDIFLSSDVKNLLKGSYSSERFVTAKYQDEIHSLLDFDMSGDMAEKLVEFEKECTDEQIEKEFNHIILELISCDTVSEEEFELLINIQKDQAQHFIGTGQFAQVLKIIKVLESLQEDNRFADITSKALRFFDTPEYISLFIDSLRMIDKSMRKDAFLLCDWYGEKIVPRLVKALIEEKSYTIRRLLINLIVHFGSAVIPEAIKHLEDSRWFVKRNMLFILRECGNEEALCHIRPYCHHENPKISRLALKCLLQTGDSYGVKVLRENMLGESGEMAALAVAIAGVFKLRELVPDLIEMLTKRTISSSDVQEKIPVVKALGQIGDSRALETLRDILLSKSFFFKHSTEMLKKEIYRSLDNYPPADVEDLPGAGEKTGILFKQ